MRLMLIMAAAFGLVAAAPAKESVSLRPGETVTLLIDDGGRTTEAGRGAAPALTPFERVAVAKLVGGAYGDVSGPNVAILRTEDGIPEPAPVPRGSIRVKLVVLDRKHSLLVVENGYDRGLAYRARIVTADRSGFSDVCEVMPVRYSFEHWPYRLKRIELSQLRLFGWAPDHRTVCE